MHNGADTVFILQLLQAISDTCSENLVEWLWCLVLRFEESNPQSSEKPWIEIGLLRYLNALGFQPWLNFFCVSLSVSELSISCGFVDICFSI